MVGGVPTLIAFGLLGELSQVDGVFVTHIDRFLSGGCVSVKFRFWFVDAVVVRLQAPEACILK